MEIELYTGCSKEQSDFFCNFASESGMQIDISKDYFGNKIKLHLNRSQLSKLSAEIFRYIMLFHLKDIIFAKIYDEYPLLDASDAGKILSELDYRLSESIHGKNVEKILLNGGKLNLESYIVFNIKIIMSTLNPIIDKLCEEKIYQKERCAFIEMIRTYSKLYDKICKHIDVEFSSEKNCVVTIDKKESVNITTDNLVSFLTEKAPTEINVRNREYCPLVADIVEEIFSGKDFSNL